jgi:peptidyl-prolyl cis-trans isomerase A (cyclophilin A)
MMRILLSILAIAFSAAAFAATPPNPEVELRTNMGTIVLEVYHENAPVTVENFLKYVKDGYYNGTIFHRVIPGFMIQAGGFTSDMHENSTRYPPIKNEAGNGIRNAPGVVSMARTADPNSATSQFFINLVENPSLDFRAPTREGYGYAPLGRVVQGMEIVNRIAQVPTAKRGVHENVPVKPVIIERARVLEKTSR